MRHITVYPGYLIKGRIRIWAIMLCLFHLIYAGGLLFDPDRFAVNEVYKVIQRIASLDFWAMGFFLPAGLFLGTVITRKFILWVLGIFFSIVVTFTWFMCLVIARLDGAPLTSGGVALWVWFLFTNLMAATVPNQIETTIHPTSDGLEP